MRASVRARRLYDTRHGRSRLHRVAYRKRTALKRRGRRRLRQPRYGAHRSGRGRAVRERRHLRQGSARENFSGLQCGFGGAFRRLFARGREHDQSRQILPQQRRRHAFAAGRDAGSRREIPGVLFLRRHLRRHGGRAHHRGQPPASHQRIRSDETHDGTAHERLRQGVRHETTRRTA